MSFAAEWWMAGLGFGGAAIAAALLWRWALEDLVLSSVELPSCERSRPNPTPLARSDAKPAQ